MTSHSLLDRFTSPRNRFPILPLHSPPRRVPSEYDLDELEPRPEDGPLGHSTPADRFRSPEPRKGLRRPSDESWKERASSVDADTRPKPRTMFAGPPPPIASSMVIQNGPGRRNRDKEAPQSGLLGSSRAKINSVLFDHRTEHAAQALDSGWRGLRRQEKALEEEVQVLLDQQAAGLIAGLGGRPPTGSDFDEHSDAGSSTPTGTFYSTATSKSRMMNSLHVPTRANADGNVIPVRQPKKRRTPGLRATRAGLRKSLVALADLKMEEDAHIEAALSQRKRALLQLDRLVSRREDVYTELHTLEDDEEELLGQELRTLGTQFDTLTRDIHQLEEKLVGMRNRRRLIRDKMDDVRNRREAGLSGYRGALRDVDADVKAIMRRPPVQPLDSEIMEQADDQDGSVNTSGGLEFLRLLPERRTVDMAKTWWQTEITILEQRKSQIGSECQALEEGGALWGDVMNLLTDFETRLRLAVKGSSGISTPEPSTAKGKEKVPSHEDVIREQLPRLEKSIAELEAHMRTAEAKGWNLLICAIGAELEAFREAHGMLREAVDPGLDDNQETGQDSPDPLQETSEQQAPSQDSALSHPAESDDNEVPADLLGSGPKEVSGSPEIDPRSGESEDDVPPEFLVEHDKDKKN